ncbi:MAG: hypothetical protein NTV93_19070 [Verrucomicrobia bacterium]|nr:hypothetical protein [Verrucomicrobiota bacterium]
MKNFHRHEGRWAKAVVLALVLLGSSFPLRATGLIFVADGLDGLRCSHCVIPDVSENSTPVLSEVATALQ